MATTRIVIQKRVKEARREASGCQDCGRRLAQGLMLGGPGSTFSELVMEPGMTWDHIQEEIDKRGFMCRRCLNQSLSVRHTGASNPGCRSQAELMHDPAVRAKMKELGIAVPEDADDEDMVTESTGVDPCPASDSDSLDYSSS